MTWINRNSEISASSENVHAAPINGNSYQLQLIRSFSGDFRRTMAIREIGVDFFVTQENINHFKRLLESETDPETREMIMMLLRKEQQKIESSEPPLPEQPDDA